MRHTVTTSQTPHKIRADEMRVGQIAKHPSGFHILRTFSGFVDLEDPSCTWPCMKSWGIMVEPVPEGTVLTLTVGAGDPEDEDEED